MISIVDITKTYKKRPVFTGLSVEIAAGELFGLTGENGAGKSTLLSILASVLPPDAGEVWIGGKSVRQQGNEVKRLVGYVPQEVALYSALSGEANLMFWGRMYGLRGRELTARTTEALATVQMEDRRHDPISAYSGGMKRRINLAAALLHNPRVLILDEPTAGVDMASRSHIMDVLKEKSRQGVTIVYTSHHMEEIMACDRIGVLKDGTLAVSGTAGN
ncbi:heme ABC exporter ATP-binding subunit CcmA [Aneurinibacillus soli]|uniref:Putative ABC transporter ATP-binding protein YxlF n=1 Tax=Aneurinibacillus soli TaxID=1500254 RepID=A0A0U5ARF0_9BACL|nr:ABC transporter ATP-binding protein [Aneurinibacillus soli]PYE60117.1 heme ABC exporter ATP-binding subunit CcmA [Aneurinibacillus soli]BAU26394.1 putative ABC transporter ATP-binding protein YxlF [Aneurinibacillus soli]